MLQSTTTQQDPTAENLLERLSDLENYPEEALVPYEELVRTRTSTTSPPVGSSTARIRGAKRCVDFSAASFPMRSGTTEPIAGGKGHPHFLQLYIIRMLGS